MILVGVGANLPNPRFGPPRATCGAALAAMAHKGLPVLRCSGWYRTAPVPSSDQPWYVNAVAEVETAFSAAKVLGVLHAVEAECGRRRDYPNAPRALDLDLLAYHGEIADGKGDGPVLPHPRMHERAFVLAPLALLAPDWRHPVLGNTASEMLAALPGGQTVEVLADAAGPFGTEWSGAGEEGANSRVPAAGL